MSPRQELLKTRIAEVVRLLNELDPYGLDPRGEGGAPADEYELEGRPMASLLLRNGGISADQVDDIWTKWFEEPLSSVVGEERIAEFVLQLQRLIAPPS